MVIKEIDHKIYICLEIIYIKHFMCISNSHHRERYDKYPVLLLAFHAFHYYYYYYGIVHAQTLSFFLLEQLENENVYKAIECELRGEICQVFLCACHAHTKCILKCQINGL